MQKIKDTVQPVFREEKNLRLEFYLRDVTVAVTLGTSCSRGVEVSKSFLEVVKVARKRVNVVQRVIRLGFNSAMKDADRNAWWRAFLNEVWQPEAHAPIVWCLSAMSSLRRSFRHLEAQSTFTSGMSGRLSVEMSLMRKSAERETVQDVMEKRCYFAFITTHSSHQLRKQTRIRPVCSQTESSSQSTLNVSVAWKFVPACFPRKKPADPRHFFPEHDEV